MFDSSARLAKPLNDPVLFPGAGSGLAARWESAQTCTGGYSLRQGKLCGWLFLTRAVLFPCLLLAEWRWRLGAVQ